MKTGLTKSLHLAVTVLFIFAMVPQAYSSPLSSGEEPVREDSPSDMDQSGYTGADTSDIVNDWETQDVNPLSAATSEEAEKAPEPEAKKAKSKPQLIRIENMRREEALAAEKKKETPAAEEKDKESESILKGEENLLS